MPNLMSLPRELRDDIYEWVFRGSMALMNVPRPRIRISKNKQACYKALSNSSQSGQNDDKLSVDGYYEGEEAIRYPSAQPVPPTDPLLHVNPQLREEMQDTIKRSTIAWRLRLSFREDKELLYPTWVSMPAFTDRIDTLDIEMRFRKKKTASLFSSASSIISDVNDDNGLRKEGDVFLGGFAMLRRLLERGPSFLSKKREPGSTQQPLTIGCVTLILIPKDYEYCRGSSKMMEECEESIQNILTDDDHEDGFNWNDPERLEEWRRIDRLLHFFAEKIDRFALQIDEMRREWVLKDAMALKDERAKQRDVDGSIDNNGVNTMTVDDGD